MKAAALIVAAGRGSRAGDGPPKQYRRLGGRSVLERCLSVFLNHPRIDVATVVIAPEHEALYAEVAARIESPKLLPPIHGGAERQESTRLGLTSLAAHEPELALIHDAARPFVSLALITRMLDALHDRQGAVAALPVVDTLHRSEDGLCAGIVGREALWRAQTPQGFRFNAIMRAHDAFRGMALTDDAEVARCAGLDVALIQGENGNVKLTTAEDFAVSVRRIEASEERGMDVRCGTGCDVHAFGPGDSVTLCGVETPHDRGLIGHSDADVGLHALTDAILGAVAEGDIGRHFPPSDPRWKGAASEIFLRRAVEIVVAKGGRIANVDVTLICERPKIGPLSERMRARVAGILGIEVSRVSVKATTTERLGFTGREEGVAAMAAATVILTGERHA